MGEKKRTNHGHKSSKKSKKVPKEPVVITISSDSESNYDGIPSEYEDGDARAPESSAVIAPGEEPSPRSKKLALRVRDSEPTDAAQKGDAGLTISVPSSRSVRHEVEDGEEDEDDEDGDEEEVFKTPLERKHVLFDNTETEEFVTPLEAPLKDPLGQGQDTEQDDEEVEDSDDEAPPEAVSSHAAQAQSTKTEEAALKAVRRQEAEKKRKRQERDAFLKKQAKDRKPAKAPVPAEREEPAEPESDDDADEADVSRAVPDVSRKRKAELPDILPPELLESDDDEVEELRKAGSALSLRPKKIKFNTAERQLVREARPPRDERVGSTVYRVMTSGGNKSMAPKMRRGTLHMKEQLMARHRAVQKRGGFLVKR